jgi:hypothetical protein
MDGYNRYNYRGWQPLQPRLSNYDNGYNGYPSVWHRERSAEAMATERSRLAVNRAGPIQGMFMRSFGDMQWRGR